MLCACFSSKYKATNVFPKHILKLEAHGQSIHATTKNVLLHDSKE